MYLLINSKSQSPVFFIGVLIFVLFNIAFNVVLPVLLNTIKYHQWGDYSTIIFLIFAAYAMTRYRLFDVRVAAGRILIGVFTFLTFFITACGGILLSKSSWYVRLSLYCGNRGFGDITFILQANLFIL